MDLNSPPTTYIIVTDMSNRFLYMEESFPKNPPDINRNQMITLPACDAFGDYQYTLENIDSGTLAQGADSTGISRGPSNVLSPPPQIKCTGKAKVSISFQAIDSPDNISNAVVSKNLLSEGPGVASGDIGIELTYDNGWANCNNITGSRNCTTDIIQTKIITYHDINLSANYIKFGSKDINAGSIQAKYTATINYH